LKEEALNCILWRKCAHEYITGHLCSEDDYQVVLDGSGCVYRRRKLPRLHSDGNERMLSSVDGRMLSEEDWSTRSKASPGAKPGPPLSEEGN